MIGALWTGISGLSSQQQALDNESNNIANVNTVGFKSSRISFADQMYQDKIGKGSKILDAEKIYEQGNLKLTGVAYDMALSGNGFFTLSNTRSSGTSETLYTRAGNFRMGDNGTLQDAAGNEVQGWMMVPLDTKNDVTSSNPNVNTFTNDYGELLSSRMIKHTTYIETITAKSTDFNKSAQNDSTSVYSGAGLKTRSGKIADIEAAIKDHSMWLQRLSENPDGASATSVAQTSVINFKSQNDSLVSKEGEQISVTIDGKKISQAFVPTTATKAFFDSIMTSTPKPDGLTRVGLTFANATDAEKAVLDKYAGQVETYKSLADKISETPGLVAYMANEKSGAIDDVLEPGEEYETTTSPVGMLKGILQIKSLIPGKEFQITQVAEESGNTKVEGAFQTSITASAGTGAGAVQSSKDALSKLITGKQRDVYSPTDLKIDTTTATNNNYRLSISIYDKDLQKNIPVPNNGGNPPVAVDLEIKAATNVDDFVKKFNEGKDANGNTLTPAISDYVEAVNINGFVVLQTKDDNYEVDFNTSLKHDPNRAYSNRTGSVPEVDTYTDSEISYPATFEYTTDGGATWKTVTTNAANEAALLTAISGVAGLTAADSGGNFTVRDDSGASALNFKTRITSGDVLPLDKNNDFSGRAGAAAEFIEIVNKVDQTATKGSLQLRLDTLGISDSAFGEFKVDSTGLITMTQDGAEIAIGQVAIALFNNNRGLEPRGDNLLAKTNESGEAIYNLNNDKTAKIEGKTLELSTADLSESLVNLMVFQRAFEANAKSITSSDQLLSTLIALKR